MKRKDCNTQSPSPAERLPSLGRSSRALQNHTLDLILSHGIDVNGVEVLQQSDDISDHYLVLCKLHIAKAVNATPSYKYGRTITSTTRLL